MKYLICICLILLLTVAVGQAQIQQYDTKHDAITGWSAECVTTWNGSHWEPGFTAVIATNGGTATLCATAPASYYPTTSEWDRYSRAFEPPQWIKETAKCPYGNPTPACCVTRFWDAEAGGHYYVKAFNETEHFELGPTKGVIASGHYNCQIE